MYVNWLHLAQDKIQQWVPVRGNMNFWGSVISGDFIAQISDCKILTHAILFSTKSVDLQDLQNQV